MPELPDIALYRVALVPRVVGRPLRSVRIASPFVLRTVDPPASALLGRRSDRRCVLADRALSRLLREDWPRTIEDLTARRL